PPDLQISNPEVPLAAEKIVRHCLEKDTAQRFQSAHDLAFALEALSGLSTGAVRPSVSAPRKQGKLWPAILLTALLTGLAAYFLFHKPQAAETSPAVLQLLINPAPGTILNTNSWPVISPDGRQVVFFATDSNGRNFLWLRVLANSNLYQLQGTEN